MRLGLGLGFEKQYRKKMLEQVANLEQVADPVIDITDGVISMTTETEGATIYYTADGSIPTIESTEYTEPFSITESATIKAIAIKNGYLDSEIKEAIYTPVLLLEYESNGYEEGGGYDGGLVYKTDDDSIVELDGDIFFSEFGDPIPDRQKTIEPSENWGDFLYLLMSNVIGDKAKLRIYNPENLSIFGLVNNHINSPKVTISIKDIPKNAKGIDFMNDSQEQVGEDWIWLKSNVIVTGDLADIPDTVEEMNFMCSIEFIYSSKDWNKHNSIKAIHIEKPINSTGLSSDDVANLIIDIAKLPPEKLELTWFVLNTMAVPTQSQELTDAIDYLNNNGVTVVVNGG